MRRPVSTYRLQLRPDFGFDEAADLVPYLDRLGVDTLYLSPVAEAVPGSEHGYDVTDPTRIRAELGGEEGLRALSRRLGEREMGLLLDIVPNHVAADARRNPWWRDVLRLGRGSACASFFDIDWEDGGLIVLPVLGAPLEEVLARGELELGPGDGAGRGSPVLRYFEHEFPLDPESVPEALLRDPSGATRSAAPAMVRDILGRQHYRLAYWRTGASDINYRRFFDISDLVALRVEDPEVFAASHALVRELVRDGVVTGLRVDHVDGLRDPAAYLVRLQEEVFGGERGYVLVEKILAPDESLPPDWPVEGTTGYDFLNVVNGLMIDPGGVAAIGRIYAEFTGTRSSFDDIVFRRKVQVQEELFAAERARLARRLRALGLEGAEDEDVEGALTAVTAALPRYRTYFSADRRREEDRRVVGDAFREARRRLPGPAAAYDALEPILSLEVDEEVSPERLEAVLRWQQYTGPVMAKGFEDTALYVYNRFMAANAVGGHPARPHAEVGEFHELCRRRASSPGAMNASSTHDSKRAEDVRARIDVLSRRPGAWAAALSLWRERSAAHGRLVDGRQVPHPNLEFLALQTVAGAWPVHEEEEAEFGVRFREYLVKAAREAKTRTSWIEPDEPYETALGEWADALAADERFHRDVRPVVRDVARRGAEASLVQVALKLTAPGVPDLYQGTELWDLSLVDPDNRRPVDFDTRRRLLDDLEAGLAGPSPETAADLLSDWVTGAVKLYLTSAILRRRRSLPGLLRDGSYTSLGVEGPAADAVCAFERRGGGRRLVVVAALRWSPAHGGTMRLPGRAGREADWRDVLTGRRFEGGETPLQDLLDVLPVAVLESRAE